MALLGKFVKVPPPGVLVLKCPECGRERLYPAVGEGPLLAQHVWFPCRQHFPAGGADWRYCGPDGKPFGAARRAGIGFVGEAKPELLLLKCPECGRERHTCGDAKLRGKRAWWPCAGERACFEGAGKPQCFELETGGLA